MKQEKLNYTEPIFEIKLDELDMDILTLSEGEVGEIDSEDFGGLF